MARRHQVRVLDVERRLDATALISGSVLERGTGPAGVIVSRCGRQPHAWSNT